MTRRLATAEERNAYAVFSQRPTTMPEMLRAQAASDGDRIAVIAPDATMTFSQWYRRVEIAAGRLRAEGVQRGDPVGLWGKNDSGAGWLTALLAIQHAGAIPVPVSSNAGVAAANDRLRLLNARIVVVEDGAGQAGPGLRTIEFAHLEHGDRLVSPDVDRGRPASIFHTSGTTGLPKATLISHESMAFIAAMTEEYILGEPVGVARLSTTDVLQTAVPLYTATGVIHVALTSIYSGLTVVCEPHFDAQATVEAARRHHSTIWLAVPAMMTLMGDTFPARVDGVDFRVIWHMGSIASAECIQATKTAFPDAAVLNLYSLTETGAGMVVGKSEDSSTKPGAAGWATPTTRIRVVDDAGQEVASGGRGEIQFDSPYMFDGYVNRPEAMAATFTSDGWFRSGDEGRIDPDGALYVEGRRGDMIVRGGHNINPYHLERVMEGVPGVRFAVVVGVPHRVLGQDVVGLVACDDHIEISRLRGLLLETFPRHEVPRVIEVVDEVPRNDFGKLDRRKAAELAIDRLSSRAKAEADRG